MVTQTTKTMDDLFNEVRFILNDNQVPYRYTDERIVYHYNTALREIFRLRPDLYIGFTNAILSANLVNTYSVSDLQVIDGEANPTPPDPPTPFPLDDRLAYGPCVFYVAGRTEIEDDEFADNNRAMKLMLQLKQQLQGIGG
jgi:hypothetical protein